MQLNDYIRVSEKLLYKHKFDRALPPDVYSMHTHNLYELLYFVKGDATCVIEERKYKLKAGDLVLVRPYLHHFVQIDTVTDYERYDILFDPVKHGVEGVWRIPEEVAIVSLAENPLASDVFRRMDAYDAICTENDFFRLLPHLLSELFLGIGSIVPREGEMGDLTSPLLSEALRYINANLFTLGGMKEVANAIFVSESYLCRLFKRELHESPGRYIRDKRLLVARDRILLGEKPTAVAAACGFGDYTAFYRSYKSLFGTSPTSKNDP